MTLPNDSILVTPGSGATLATQAISSKEYEAWVGADAAGNIIVDQLGVWATSVLQLAYRTSPTVLNAISLLNADASLIVDILGVWACYEMPSISVGESVAVVRLRRMTAHSGGTSQTPVKVDSTSGSLDADITARSSATSVTGTGEDLAAKRLIFNPGNSVGFVMEKNWLWHPRESPPIVCRQNEGVYVYGTSLIGSAAEPQGSFGLIFRVR